MQDVRFGFPCSGSRSTSDEIQPVRYRSGMIKNGSHARGSQYCEWLGIDDSGLFDTWDDSMYRRSEFPSESSRRTDLHLDRLK